MAGAEGSGGALTPSWDRLLTSRELDDAFFGLSPASPLCSGERFLIFYTEVRVANLRFAITAVGGELPFSKDAQSTFEADNLPQETERKLARAFTFSSESVAKISPVTQVKSCSTSLH